MIMKLIAAIFIYPTAAYIFIVGLDKMKEAIKSKSLLFFAEFIFYMVSLISLFIINDFLWG